MKWALIEKFLTIFLLLVEYLKTQASEERKDAIRRDPRGELRRMFIINEQTLPSEQAEPDDLRDSRGDSDS